MMTAMPNTPGRFRAVVGVGWIVLALAAFLYAGLKAIPAQPAILISIAFLFEFPFYLSPAFPSARIRNPWLLALSCVLPWLVYSAPLGLVDPLAALFLIGIALSVALWFVVLPRTWWSDILFLALLTAITVVRPFDSIFLSPIPKLKLGTLGHLMLIRAGATAFLSFRADTPVEYRFLPTAREWITGLKWFAVALPVLAGALWALGLWRLRADPKPWTLLPTFLGIFWVVSLSEEFFFRGLLQQWLQNWTRSSIAALAGASILFGLVHLGFHFFPNWTFMIAAGLLGAAAGLAFRETRTIQSGMVTHAIAATLYRVFFE